MVDHRRVELLKGKDGLSKATNLEIKHRISIIISILILVFSIANVLIMNFSDRDKDYIVENGVLNLSDWSVDGSESIRLDGAWEFYPHVFIDPTIGNESSPFDEKREIRKYVEVPGSWERYLNEDGSIEGGGTYRILIKVPKDGVYGIKTNTIRLASRIYLNGQEVANIGKPSLSIDDFTPGSKYKLGFTSSTDNEIELVIHVASYGYRSGGILKSIKFGTFETIMTQNNEARAMDVLIISACLILGLYFFFTYFHRKKEVYLKYFSIASFFMALQLSTMNEQLLDLICNYSLIARTRIQILAGVMVTICFLKFIHHFFTDYSNHKITNKITKLMVLILIFVFNSPEKQISIPAEIEQTIFMVTLAISYSYIFHILIKAIYNKADALEYILVITATLFSYWLSIIIKAIFEIELGYLPPILIFMLILSTASLMSRRLQLDYQKANDLSEKFVMYDKMKNEFLAKTSHELRTPLHVMINLTQFILEGKKGTLNTKQQEDILFVHHESQRLARLVDDLLDASKIEKGEINLIQKPIEIYSVVEDLMQEMKIFIPEDKALMLRNQISNDFPMLNADPDRFRQIIYNLLHNAIKYTECGEIIVSASVKGKKAEIAITDTGIGIKEKYIKDIFTTFHQKVDESSINQGFGLGLSIVKNLVESHGGAIHVESTYKKGSSFIFTLPLYNSELEIEEIASDIEKASQPIILKDIYSEIKKENKIEIGKYTVLIVDDEIANQKVLSDLIHHMELNTLIADSGEEALNIIKKNKIDLVILDFMLPDMWGDEICKKIRQVYSMVELPILILTASGRITDLMNAFEYGANDFQRKPADAEELKSRIQSLLLMKASVEEGLNKELQYFYSQISPHFFYNTLNTIIGLSYKDNDKTREALYNLATYFRGKLDLHRHKSLISLEAELELATAYLEIEQIRYGERLNIEYDIEEGLNAMLPPFTLQPLIENSVFHGIAAKRGGGKIRISIKREDPDYINIIIEDDGLGMTTEKQRELLNGEGKGIGFVNAVKKINMLKNSSLELESKLGEGTRITIVVPEDRT